MLILLLLLQASAGAVLVHKCCPSGSSLDRNKECFKHPAAEYVSTRPDDLPQGSTWTYTGQLCKPEDAYLAYYRGVVVSPSGSVTLGNVTYPPSTFCLDYVRTTPVLRFCPCSIMTCYRKCCSFGEILEVGNSLLNVSCIKSDFTEDWSPNFTSPGIPIVKLQGYPSCITESGVYMLSTSPLKVTGYSIQKDGSALIGDSDDAVIPREDYCAEATFMNGKLVDNLIICLKTINGRGFLHRLIYCILLVIGSIFLLLTLLVQYSLIELRRTVHSRNLISHTFALFVGYLILSIQSFGYVPSSTAVCALLGYLTQFAFLAAFFWLNVMCIDITWTFSGFRIPEGNSINESEGKKYIYYSIYVWGSTLVIVLVTLSVDLLSEGTRITPGFGTQRCWFKSKLATFVFFYLPITLTLLSNVFLFVFTSFKIIKVRRDTGVLLREDGMRQNSSNFTRFSEFRYTLYLKLSLLMGISWIFEVIAWAADDEEKYYYFYIFTDGFNALRGVFVFFLFSRKRKLVELVRSKLSSISGIGDKIRKRKIKKSSSKSIPGDSSTLYTSNPTQQTQTD